MNKMFENIIIDSDVRNVFTSCYSKDSAINKEQCKLYRYTSNRLPCSSAEMFARDTNALYILNKYLSKIIDNKDDYKQIKIYLNTSLHNKIESGRYKYWVETGYTQTGKTIANKELEQWKIFALLYGQVFTKITFKDSKLLTMKEYKYNKEEMEYGREVYNRIHERLIKKAEEDLHKKIFNA